MNTLPKISRIKEPLAEDAENNTRKNAPKESGRDTVKTVKKQIEK